MSESYEEGFILGTGMFEPDGQAIFKLLYS